MRGIKNIENINKFIDTPRGVILVLFATWLVHLVGNALYIVSDLATPTWPDMHNHLKLTFDAAALLRYFGLGALPLASSISTVEWPPLVYWVHGLLAILVDPALAAIRIYNMLWLGLLLVGTYATAAQVGRRMPALAAACVVSFLPAMVAGARHFSLDFPCTAMVSIAMALLLASRGFTRPRASIGFGLCVGLGVLVRGQTLVFVLGPALVSLASSLGQRRFRSLLGAGGAAALALVVSAPWWVEQLRPMLAVFGHHFEASEIPIVEGDPTLWGGVNYYFTALPGLVTLPLLLLFIPLLLLALWKGRKSRRWEIAAWLLVPLAFHIVSVARASRYILPLLPALPVAAAMGLSLLPWPRVRRGLVLVTGVLAVLPWLLCLRYQVFSIPGSHSEGPASIAMTCTKLFCGRGISPPARPEMTLGMARGAAEAIHRENPDGRGAIFTIAPFPKDREPPPFIDAYTVSVQLQLRAHLPMLLFVSPNVEDQNQLRPWQAGAVRNRPAIYVLAMDTGDVVRSSRLLGRFQSACGQARLSVFKEPLDSAWRTRLFGPQGPVTISEPNQ